jgi:hypothetical protein
LSLSGHERHRLPLCQRSRNPQITDQKLADPVCPLCVRSRRVQRTEARPLCHPRKQPRWLPIGAAALARLFAQTLRFWRFFICTSSETCSLASGADRNLVATDVATHTRGDARRDAAEASNIKGKRSFAQRQFSVPKCLMGQKRPIGDNREFSFGPLGQGGIDYSQLCGSPLLSMSALPSKATVRCAPRMTRCANCRHSRWSRARRRDSRLLSRTLSHRERSGASGCGFGRGSAGALGRSMAYRRQPSTPCSVPRLATQGDRSPRTDACLR